ncbi:unnamed protein product [Schistosoma haematobium]|nr:unnamed protein product [Schistosoma haematobium]CAH8493066.1 unnamed protein product [Schistosoma haematobium]
MSFCKKRISHRHLQVTVIISSLIIIGCAVALITIGSIFYNSVRKYNGKLETTVKGVIKCLVIVGCIMIFSGFLGLFGSCLNSNDVLCLFSVGLVTIIIVQLGTGITCLCYHVKLWDNLHLSMKKAVENYHFNKTISTIMDKIHRDLKCCGSLNYLEYGDKIPSSCHEDGSIYKNGCTDVLNQFGSQFLTIGTVFSFMFIILEIITIGCSIYLTAYIDAKDQR